MQPRTQGSRFQNWRRHQGQKGSEIRQRNRVCVCEGNMTSTEQAVMRAKSPRVDGWRDRSRLTPTRNNVWPSR
eukprot:6187650-Pleurochrysis_carterae.AAC.1